jgi:hypothetical protein
MQSVGTVGLRSSCGHSDVVAVVRQNSRQLGNSHADPHVGGRRKSIPASGDVDDSMCTQAMIQHCRSRSATAERRVSLGCRLQSPDVGLDEEPPVVRRQDHLQMQRRGSAGLVSRTCRAANVILGETPPSQTWRYVLRRPPRRRVAFMPPAMPSSSPDTSKNHRTGQYDTSEASTTSSFGPCCRPVRDVLGYM